MQERVSVEGEGRFHRARGSVGEMSRTLGSGGGLHKFDTPIKVGGDSAGRESSRNFEAPAVSLMSKYFKKSIIQEIRDKYKIMD